MNIEIIGSSEDIRTSTKVLYAKIAIEDYIDLVGEEFGEFYIQRKREKHKAYDRMREDIKAGTLLPTITLAVKTEKAKQYIEKAENDDKHGIISLLHNKSQVNILDGLQRTYIIKDLVDEGYIFRDNHFLFLEIWIEENIKTLIYRIIVLNAGQKPMSMRHQVELLFLTLKEKLEKNINIEIFTEREQSRRSRSRKYSLDRIVSSYQCFITKNTEIEKANIVSKALREEDVFSSTEDDLGDTYDDYVKYLEYFCLIDDLIERHYSKNNVKKSSSPLGWWGSENVMNAFFASISDFSRNEDKKNRVKNALLKLMSSLEEKANSDPLALLVLNDIIDGYNPRKINVGHRTRKLLLNGFKEFFREEGDKTLEECWISEADSE